MYDDLVLVFANALHYNENASQIAKDAITLKVSSPSVVDYIVASDTLM